MSKEVAGKTLATPLAVGVGAACCAVARNETTSPGGLGRSKPEHASAKQTSIFSWRSVE
jgi:hypothetical protein